MMGDEPRYNAVSPDNHVVVIDGPVCASVVSDPQGVEAARWNNPKGLTRRERMLETVREVAHKHGVAMSEIFSRDRTHRVVDARHEAIARVHQANPDMSFPRIGRLFGRDHTTVMFAVQRHGKLRLDGRPYAKVQGPARVLKTGVFTTTKETNNENT